MKRKALKIGLVTMLVGLVIFLVPPVNQSISGFLSESGMPNSMNIIITVVIAVAGLLLLWPVIMMISRKYDLWSLNKSLGQRKCFTLEQSIKAALKYTTEKTGIPELFIYDQDVDDPETDTPYVTFVITDWKINMTERNREHEIEKHRLWFVIVNRMTNEISNRWGTINSWEEADTWMTGKKQRDLPIEKRKTAMEKLTEKVVEGYYGKIGAESAAVKPKKKEEEENDK